MTGIDRTLLTVRPMRTIRPVASSAKQEPGETALRSGPPHSERKENICTDGLDRR